MKIDTLQVGYLSTNCYIITSESNPQAVIIDSGASAKRILAWLENEKKTPAAVLLTHGHFDHIGAVSDLQKAGAKIYIHEKDAEMLKKGGLGTLFGLKFAPVEADVLLKGGETLNLAGRDFKVIHTAGHTKGGVCYLCGNDLFCGDTIFSGDFGRTDLEGGSFEELKASILEKIFTLPDGVILHAGHGEESTVGKEKVHNEILTKN